MKKCIISSKECRHASGDEVMMHKRCGLARKPDDCPIVNPDKIVLCTQYRGKQESDIS